MSRTLYILLNVLKWVASISGHCVKRRQSVHIHKLSLLWLALNTATRRIFRVRTETQKVLMSTWRWNPCSCCVRHESQLPLFNFPPSAIVAQRQQWRRRQQQAHMSHVPRCSPCMPFHSLSHSHSTLADAPLNEIRTRPQNARPRPRTTTKNFRLSFCTFWTRRTMGRRKIEIAPIHVSLRYVLVHASPPSPRAGCPDTLLCAAFTERAQPRSHISQGV